MSSATAGARDRLGLIVIALVGVTATGCSTSSPERAPSAAAPGTTSTILTGDPRGASPQGAATTRSGTGSSPTSPLPPTQRDSTLAADAEVIASVTAISVQGGRSYEITPTALLRATPTVQAADVAWDQLIERHDIPDQIGLHDQFVCHVVFAPAKPVWHIEPWRPEVGWVKTVMAGCNPGDIPDPDLIGSG